MDETSSTPLKFKRTCRRFVQYKWLATRGVDEEPILHAYLWIFIRASSFTNNWTLLDEYFFFLQMDDQLLDAICGLLVSLLKYSRKLYSLRRFYGDAFYYQGKTRELNSKWRVNSFLQLNYFETWTVRALEEVEAFALRAEDLKFVANQCRRLHSKKLKHTFCFYAYHWRTWAACFIQAAWRRHKKRMIAKILSMSESSVSVNEQTVDDETTREEDAPSFAPSNSQSKQHLGVTILASRFATNTRRGAQKVKNVEMLRLQKLKNQTS